VLIIEKTKNTHADGFRNLGKLANMPDTSYETSPGQNSEQDERRTSNIQRRMSNIDGATLYRF
jgi:hypothetical protein